MTDPRTIAAGLSEAQARLVLWLDGVTFKDWDESGTPGNSKTHRIVAHLTEQGAKPWWRRLNATGLAVRACLMEDERGDR